MTKVRELKRHEQKLLKKVDFLSWKSDGVSDNFRKQMLFIISKYKLSGEKEFFDYQKVVNQVNETIKEIKAMDSKTHMEFKKQQFEILSQKLYDMGVLDTLNELETKSRVTHLAENVTLASDYVQHGHIRIGPEIVKDPAFIVSRGLEDFIAWAHGSRIRETVKRYNDEYDDYEIQNA